MFGCSWPLVPLVYAAWWLGFQALHTSLWPGWVTQVDITCYLDSSLLTRNSHWDYCYGRWRDMIHTVAMFTALLESRVTETQFTT